MAETVVKIYGKMGWPFSEGARSAYGDSAVYVDVLRDKAKYKEMLAYTKGVSRVPVIVEGEKVTIGYGGSWTL
jgi:glutaredoxin 3